METKSSSRNSIDELVASRSNNNDGEDQLFIQTKLRQPTYASLHLEQSRPLLDHSFPLSAGSQVSPKSLSIIPNKRRPVKKRMRTLIQSQQHRFVSPNETSTSILKPETLYDDPPFPTRKVQDEDTPSEKMTNTTSVLMNNGSVLGWIEDDTESVAMAVESVASKTGLKAITPPRLCRDWTSVFPTTAEHYTVLEEQSTRNAQWAMEQSSIPFSPLRQLDGTISVHSTSLLDETMEEEENEDEESGKTVIEKAVPPPSLGKSESDSLCLRLKEAFESPSRSNSMENAINSKKSYIYRKPQVSSSWTTNQQEHGDNMIQDAVATMQFPMISTPKRSFRLKKNSFTSFASSASGSSRSSCVTPSPSKKMMASRMNSDFEIRPFDHRPSRSMGSLDGFSDMSVDASNGKNSTSAPEVPDLLDPVKALSSIKQNYKLTEEQKVDQAKMFIVIPPKLKPKNLSRTLSGTKGLRKDWKPEDKGIFGRKRSFSQGKKPARIIQPATPLSEAVISRIQTPQGVPPNGAMDFTHLHQRQHLSHQQFHHLSQGSRQGFTRAIKLSQRPSPFFVQHANDDMSWIHQQPRVQDLLSPLFGGGGGSGIGSAGTARSSSIPDKVESNTAPRRIT